MASNIGVNNNMFGGTLMSWIDEASAAFATEFCETPNMVTLKVSELLFKKPIKKANIIKIYGNVIRVGNTSITIDVEVRMTSVERMEEEVVTTAQLTFVKIDNDGKPVKIPAYITEKMSNDLLLS